MMFVLLILCFFNVYGGDKSGEFLCGDDASALNDVQSVGCRRLQSILRGDVQADGKTTLLSQEMGDSQKVVQYLVFETHCYQDVEMMLDRAVFLKLYTAVTDFVGRRVFEDPAGRLEVLANIQSAFESIGNYAAILQKEGAPKGSPAFKALVGAWLGVKNLLNTFVLAQMSEGTMVLAQ